MPLLTYGSFKLPTGPSRIWPKAPSPVAPSLPSADLGEANVETGRNHVGCVGNARWLDLPLKEQVGVKVESLVFVHWCKEVVYVTERYELTILEFAYLDSLDIHMFGIEEKPTATTVVLCKFHDVPCKLSIVWKSSQAKWWHGSPFFEYIEPILTHLFVEWVAMTQPTSKY